MSKLIVKYSNCSDLKFCFLLQEHTQEEVSFVFIIYEQTTQARETIMYIVYFGK